MCVCSLKKLACVAAVLASLAFGNKVWAETSVSITNRGRDVILSNGIVTATIDVANAGITSMEFEGHQMVSNTGPHRVVYFSRDGGTITLSQETSGDASYVMYDYLNLELP